MTTDRMLFYGIVGCLAAPANDTGKTLHLLVHARKAPAPYKTKHETINDGE